MGELAAGLEGAAAHRTPVRSDHQTPGRGGVQLVGVGGLGVLGGELAGGVQVVRRL